MCEILLKDGLVKQPYQPTIKQSETINTVKINIHLHEGFRQTRIIVKDEDKIIRGAGNLFLKTQLCDCNGKKWYAKVVVNIRSMFVAPSSIGLQLNATEILVEKISESDNFCYENHEDVIKALT